jgi:hypothetical protein
MLVVSVVMYAVSAAHWALIVANTVRWSSVDNVFLPPSVVIALICLSTVNVRHSSTALTYTGANRNEVYFKRRYCLVASLGIMGPQVHLFHPPTYLHALCIR